MNTEVAKAVEQLCKAFPSSVVEATDDGQGGAYVFLSDMDLGERYVPRLAWLGAQLPALYPYADIYPVFMNPAVVRADGKPFEAPVTHGANFAGRPAIQISRRNNHAQTYPQPAVAKFLKVLDFLARLT